MAELPTTVTIEVAAPPTHCPSCGEKYTYVEHPLKPGVPMMMKPCPCTEAKILKWDRRFLELAKLISTWSKDPSTKIGCVIVGPNREIRSTGYNGFARGVADNERLHNREEKYPLIVHAEENCVLNGALVGVSLKGCKSYAGWPPCPNCARMLIQVGISEVIFENREVPERWAPGFQLAQRMLTEAGVPFRGVSLAG
jgi:dCMP deaminase